MTESCFVLYWCLMNRVLFLDVDGVLNCPNEVWAKFHNLQNNPSDQINQEMFDRLVKTCNDNGLNIVLSSSWRYSEQYRTTIVNKLIEACLKVVGFTKIDVFTWRHEEIQDWLNENDVDAFVIVDDMRSASNSKLDRYFVQTNGSIGLTDKDCEKITNIIQKQVKVTEFESELCP